MRVARRIGVATVSLMLLASPLQVSSDAEPADALRTVLAAAGLRPGDVAPDPRQHELSPTRVRQSRPYRDLMRDPLSGIRRADELLENVRDARDSPPRLFAVAAELAGVELGRRRSTGAAPGDAFAAGSDPLASALGWMKPAAAAAGMRWPPELPDRSALAEPLRSELARMLAAIGRARHSLDLALARLPAALTAGQLRAQWLEAGSRPDRSPDLAELLPLVDREVLLAGMSDLLTATHRLQRFVASASLPSVTWQVDTPHGAIVVDTTGRDNIHRLAAPMLLLDVGGHDRYDFLAAGPARHIAVVLDHGGDDRYHAAAAGADPSAATLGYGILWDSAGDDEYIGTDLAQSAALFGATLLIDSAGANRFVAAGHAQAFALGGVAVLASSPGNDEFIAQTHAQASAAAEGVALLVEPDGNDRYTLGNEPLSRRAPQLPTHNTSMGQGAGRGWRTAGDGGNSATGGISMLIDLAGNDAYEAQVFAQGVGYHEGVGLLLDAGGSDRFDAAWYAMGAAAHRAVGILLKRGNGADRYRATHSTSLGAAHDFSVALFFDEGGDDHYALGDLGLGAAHDNGIALFVDAQGRDRYEVSRQPCRAFGFAQLGEPEEQRDGLSAAGLFMDLGGVDQYPAVCPAARNDAAWTPTDRRAAPSRAAAGLDGDYALPAALQRRGVGAAKHRS